MVKENAASLRARGTGVGREGGGSGTGVGREGGGSTCSQASGLLALSSGLFFLLVYQAPKSKKITTAPTKDSR